MSPAWQHTLLVAAVVGAWTLGIFGLLAVLNGGTRHSHPTPPTPDPDAPDPFDPIETEHRALIDNHPTRGTT